VFVLRGGWGGEGSILKRSHYLVLWSLENPNWSLEL